MAAHRMHVAETDGGDNMTVILRYGFALLLAFSATNLAPLMGLGRASIFTAVLILLVTHRVVWLALLGTLLLAVRVFPSFESVIIVAELVIGLVWAAVVVILYKGMKQKQRLHST